MTPGNILGHALTVVTLVDNVLFKYVYLRGVNMSRSCFEPGMYALILENLRLIKPFSGKGKLHLWEFDHEIKNLPSCKTKLKRSNRAKHIGILLQYEMKSKEIMNHFGKVS